MQPIVCVCSACARLAQLLSNAPVTVHEIHTQAQVVFFWLRCSLRIISQKVKHANRKFAYPANDVNKLNVYFGLAFPQYLNAFCVPSVTRDTSVIKRYISHLLL